MDPEREQGTASSGRKEESSGVPPQPHHHQDGLSLSYFLWGDGRNQERVPSSLWKKTDCMTPGPK